MGHDLASGRNGTASVLVASAKAAGVRASGTWSKLGRSLAARSLSARARRAVGSGARLSLGGFTAEKSKITRETLDSRARTRAKGCQVGVLNVAERNTTENYLALLPLLTQPGRVHLLHDQALRHQLAGLERRTHAGDRESVSHANTQSAHDDVAAAAAGALVLAASSHAVTAKVAAELTGISIAMIEDHVVKYGELGITNFSPGAGFQELEVRLNCDDRGS